MPVVLGRFCHEASLSVGQSDCTRCNGGGGRQGPKCIIGSVQTRSRLGKCRIVEPVEARNVAAPLHGYSTVLLRIWTPAHQATPHLCAVQKVIYDRIPPGFGFVNGLSKAAVVEFRGWRFGDLECRHSTGQGMQNGEELPLLGTQGGALKSSMAHHVSMPNSGLVSSFSRRHLVLCPWP